MTTTQLQLRRDTTANIGGVTPAQGEPIYDVTRKALVLGDGATAGGNAVTPFAGTWTPQLEFGGADAGMTVSAAQGSYVMVGPLVFAFFYIALTAKGSSTGAATVTLPFPAALLAGNNCNGLVQIGLHQNLATTPSFECQVSGVGGAYLNLGKSGAASWAALEDTDFTNTSAIEGVAIYPAAQPTA